MQKSVPPGQFRCDGIWDNNERMRSLGAGDGQRLLGHMGPAPVPLDYDTPWWGAGVIF